MRDPSEIGFRRCMSLQMRETSGSLLTVLSWHVCCRIHSRRSKLPKAIRIAVLRRVAALERKGCSPRRTEACSLAA